MKGEITIYSDPVMSLLWLGSSIMQEIWYTLSRELEDRVPCI